MDRLPWWGLTMNWGQPLLGVEAIGRGRHPQVAPTATHGWPLAGPHQNALCLSA